MMSLLRHGLSYSSAVQRVILPRWLLPQSAVKGVKPMYSRVSEHFVNRADRLILGQLDELVMDYVYPLPMHLVANRIVLRNPQEARAVFGLLREELLERGVLRLRPMVSAMDIPRAGRFRVWVDWHELAAEPEKCRSSSAIYYCRHTQAGPKTEMIAYTRLSMPELNPQFAALALSA